MTRHGSIFRTLRTYGVEAEPSTQPSRSATPSRPSNTATPAARVDDVEESSQPPISATPSRSSNSATPVARVDDVEASVTEAQWEVVDNYADAEEGESTWTLKGRDQGGIDRAKTTITQAIEKAQAATHVGFLTLPDSSSFPRIVGTKGSNIARLHDMTGAHILVARDNSTITITGTRFSPLIISRIKKNCARLCVLAGGRKGSHPENDPRPSSPEAGLLTIPHITILYIYQVSYGNRLSTDDWRYLKYT